MGAFKEAEIIPIEIRKDHIVRIHGIPHDLTKVEAKKIADIILAFARPGSKQ